MGHLTALRSELLTEYVPRAKPIMAVQITDGNAADVARMVGGKLYPRDKTNNVRIYFHCCNGRAKAEWGDWITRDSRGFSAMTDQEFHETYQEKK